MTSKKQFICIVRFYYFRILCALIGQWFMLSQRVHKHIHVQYIQRSNSRPCHPPTSATCSVQMRFQIDPTYGDIKTYLTPFGLSLGLLKYMHQRFHQVCFVNLKKHFSSTKTFLESSR